MIIKSVELSNFRNYDKLNLNFCDGTNILYGDNAQGKTNILESIYVSGTSKSHKSVKDAEMISFGKEEAHIRVKVNKHDMDYDIDIHIKNNKSKGIAINKVPIKKASDLFGILNVVLFSPEDLDIIKDGPAKRRRFLDSELCQIDRIYLSNLTNYNKVLIQRNKLLKEMYCNTKIGDTLEVWNQQLVNYGSKIIERRNEFIEELNTIIFGIHKNLSGNREELTLYYEPNVRIQHFEEKLSNSLERDKRYSTTNVGPHRDDFSFIINNVDIRKYGSQGQQRSAALSLKLSEIELVKKVIHDVPVLLLDDVLSELDSKRQRQLLESITNIQTIITCTGLDEFINSRFKIDQINHVINGTVESDQE